MNMPSVHTLRNVAHRARSSGVEGYVHTPASRAEEREWNRDSPSVGRNHGCVEVVRCEGTLEKYAWLFVGVAVAVVVVGGGTNDPASSFPSFRRSSRFPFPPSRLLWNARFFSSAAATAATCISWIEVRRSAVCCAISCGVGGRMARGVYTRWQISTKRNEMRRTTCERWTRTDHSRATTRPLPASTPTAGPGTNSAVRHRARCPLPGRRCGVLRGGWRHVGGPRCRLCCLIRRAG